MNSTGSWSNADFGLHGMRTIANPRSEPAGSGRVMESVTRFITMKLKLKVNQQKSAVARPWKRKFLRIPGELNKAFR